MAARIASAGSALTYFCSMGTSRVVRTTFAGRLIAVLTGAALLVASSAQATGLHRCPVHDAPPAASSLPHQAAGEHAGHAGTMDHSGTPADQQTPHCCCIDQGCCSAPLASLPGGVAVADLPAPTALTQPIAAARRAPGVVPHLTPPSTGPPPARA
jgi:hypothetical protein